MADENYYKVLGISSDATDQTIRKSYLKLSKKFHPDKNLGNESAVKMFQAIQSAFDTLSDPLKRTIHDLELAITERDGLVSMHENLGPLANVLGRINQLQSFIIPYLANKIAVLQQEHETKLKAEQEEDERKQQERLFEEQQKTLIAEELKQSICEAIKTGNKQFLESNDNYAYSVEELFCAIQNGQNEVLQIILDNFADDINNPLFYPHSSERMYCIIEAVSKYNLEGLKTLLQIESLNINVESMLFATGEHVSGRVTALGLSIFAQESKYVEAILSSRHAHRANLTSKVPNDAKPLYIKNSAYDLSTLHESHLPLIIYASMRNEHTILELLIKAGAYVHATSHRRLSTLYYAIAYSLNNADTLKTLDILLSQNTDINATFTVQGDQLNLLTLAVILDNSFIINYLLSQEMQIISLQNLEHAMYLYKFNNKNTYKNSSIYIMMQQYRKVNYRFNWFNYAYENKLIKNNEQSMLQTLKHALKDFKSLCAATLHAFLFISIVVIYNMIRLVLPIILLGLPVFFPPLILLVFIPTQIPLFVWPAIFVADQMKKWHDPVVNKLTYVIETIVHSIFSIMSNAIVFLISIPFVIIRACDCFKNIDVEQSIDKSMRENMHVIENFGEQNSYSIAQNVTNRGEFKKSAPILHRFDMEEDQNEAFIGVNLDDDYSDEDRSDSRLSLGSF